MGALSALNIFAEVPRWIVVRTVSLWVCYLSIALPDSVRGPTLLDVRDVVGVSTQEMSYVFMVAAIGGLFGCLIVGLVLDRVSSSTKYLVLFASAVMVAVLSSALPYSSGLYSILGNSILSGFFTGTFHTCGNVLFLHIWRGRQSCPHMFAMHFAFGVGSLLSPLIAKPFIREAVDDPIAQSEISLQNFPSASQSVDIWTVKTLYPLIGVQLVLLVSPLLVFYVKERALEQKEKEKLEATAKAVEEVDSTPKDEQDDFSSCKKVVLMALMFLMYNCIAGIEISFRSYISTFTVSMGYTRQDGTDVTALFYASFTAVRGISVLGGIFLPPAAVLWTSQFICLGGMLLMSAFAAQSFLVIQLGAVCLGAGTACLFAAGLLWLKDVLTISNRIGATLTIAMNMATQIYGFIIGSIIEAHPMIFIHLMTGTAVALVVIFAIIINIVKYFRSSSKLLSRI